jgi:hypothetical protein
MKIFSLNHWIGSIVLVPNNLMTGGVVSGLRDELSPLWWHECTVAQAACISALLPADKTSESAGSLYMDKV